MEPNFSQEKLYDENIEVIDFINGNVEDLKETSVSEFWFSYLDRVVKEQPIYLNYPDCSDLKWLNTTHDFDFNSDLKNKIYILDFFTVCCINCIHILPLLKEVEEEFKNEIAVIGVHTPKYDNEKNSDRLKEAISLNNITHPVVNDCTGMLWKTYGCICWPTVFIVGPMHKLLFVLIGEAQINKILFLTKIAHKYYQASGDEIDARILPVIPIAKPGVKNFFYPGNISTNGEFLLISNTGNNNLLLMKPTFSVEEVIGSGNTGFDDGPFDKASFNNPHGTCWYGSSAFVADTGNHAIRKIDFVSKMVSTVCLNMEGNANINFEHKFIKTMQYRGFFSPWDVCLGPKSSKELDAKELNTLYIAVAGAHQIWHMRLDSTNVMCVPFAGSGKELNKKNLYRLKAGFAQPTGITYSAASGCLYVVDSESSAIRKISLHTGAVDTISGGGRDPMDLFSYGDSDGLSFETKFQHPMGICELNDTFIAIADTYNHSIKVINLTNNICKKSSTEQQLCEPGGLCVFEDHLYIADTNNHRIRIHKLETEIFSRDFYQPLIDVETTNKAENELLNINIKFGAKISVFVDVTSSDMHRVLNKSTLPWELLFKGPNHFNIKCMSRSIFDGSTIELNAEEFSFAKGYDLTNICELTFIHHFEMCNLKDKTCSLKKIKHKVIANFKKNGARVVNLKLQCIDL